jgi:hypothetical protein
MKSYFFALSISYILVEILNVASFVFYIIQNDTINLVYLINFSLILYIWLENYKLQKELEKKQ